MLQGIGGSPGLSGPRGKPGPQVFSILCLSTSREEGEKLDFWGAAFLFLMTHVEFLV